MLTTQVIQGGGGGGLSFPSLMEMVVVGRWGGVVNIFKGKGISQNGGEGCLEMGSCHITLPYYIMLHWHCNSFYSVDIIIAVSIIDANNKHSTLYFYLSYNVNKHVL